VIRELGLELQIIFNKGAVMVLPPGVNKATGLTAALEELGLSPHNVEGVGGAENEHAFMRVCGVAGAVANALPVIKTEGERAREGVRGAGGMEDTEMRIADASSHVPARQLVVVGKTRGGDDVYLEPRRCSGLIAGTSGVGKSMIATALPERMAEQGFEFCVLD